jgi:glycosyltransferase involved in cell wall biosynthesis
LLVERSDAGALAGAVERLLADADLRVSLGRRASETVTKKFSDDRVVNDLLRAYGQGTQ